MFQNTFMSISTKLSLTVSILILLLIAVFSSILLYRENVQLEENLSSKGLTITRNVAMTCATALMGNDFSFLKQVATELVNDQDIIYAMILSKTNEVIALSSDNAKGEASLLEMNKDLGSITEARQLSFYSKAFKTEVFDIAVPIIVLQEKWGTVRLGISQEELKRKSRSNIIMVVLLSLAAILIGVLAVFQLGRRISRPIQQLVQSASIIAQGILDEPILVLSNDEVGVLAHTFEKMRTSLKSQITEIARKAMSLEGDLKVFSLPDMIQLVCTNQQMGVIHLKKDNEWGKIYISKGAIMAVENNWNEDYTNAFLRYFNWTSGEIKFERCPVEMERTVPLSWEHIIMEGARHTDELERIKQVLPSETSKVAVVINPPENVKKIKLTIEELQLSSLIQGERTVRELLDKSPFDELKTYTLLYSLISAGLIFVVGQREKVKT
jgi:HAMP domain-containing protein